MSSSQGDYVQNAIYSKFVNNNTQQEKFLEEYMYRRLLTELAVNRFKWTGMPEEIDCRFLELTLFYQALSLFYFEGRFDKYMAVRGGGIGAINALDQPTEYLAILNGTDGTPNRQLKKDECVPIWSNYLRTPDWDVVTIYSKRLSDFDVTVDTNIIGLRHPTVFAVEESERQSFANIFRSIKRGEPAIYGYKNLSPQDLKDKLFALNTGVQTNAVTDVQISKSKVWNECMTYLGINNSNQEKRERLVEDEVSANNDQVNAFRNIALNARKQACEEINKMFGLNVDVEWNLDSSYDKEEMEDENGELHDGIEEDSEE